MIKKETSFIDLKQVKIDDPFFSRVQNVVIHTMIPYQERVLHDEVSGIRKSHVCLLYTSKVASLSPGVRSSKKLALFLAVGHSPYKEKKR